MKSKLEQFAEHVEKMDIRKRAYSIVDLLNERQQTHGSFQLNAAISQNLKQIMYHQPGYPHLTVIQREVLDMLCLKLSRILSGSGSHADHWKDIAGYATLALNEIDEEVAHEQGG